MPTRIIEVRPHIARPEELAEHARHDLPKAYADLTDALARMRALLADDGTAPAPGTLPWADTVAVASRRADRAARRLRALRKMADDDVELLPDGDMGEDDADGTD